MERSPRRRDAPLEPENAATHENVFRQIEVDIVVTAHFGLVFGCLPVGLPQ
jgi:hypothetical protein